MKTIHGKIEVVREPEMGGSTVAYVKVNGVTEFEIHSWRGSGESEVTAMVYTAEGHIKRVWAARVRRYLHKKSAMTLGIEHAKKAAVIYGSGTKYITEMVKYSVSPAAMVDPSIMASELMAQVESGANTHISHMAYSKHAGKAAA